MGSFRSLGAASIEPIDYRSSLKGTSIESIDRSCANSQAKYRVIADRLLDRLGEPASWRFYAKCAYHLSEDQIWYFVELATRPQIRDKNRYFVKLASNAMR